MGGMARRIGHPEASKNLAAAEHPEPLDRSTTAPRHHCNSDRRRVARAAHAWKTLKRRGWSGFATTQVCPSRKRL